MAKFYGVSRFTIAIKQDMVDLMKEKEEAVENYLRGGGNDPRGIEDEFNQILNGMIRALKTIHKVNEEA